MPICKRRANLDAPIGHDYNMKVRALVLELADRHG